MTPGIIILGVLLLALGVGERLGGSALAPWFVVSSIVRKEENADLFNLVSKGHIVVGVICVVFGIVVDY